MMVGNILMLSEGRAGVDTVFELRDGEFCACSDLCVVCSVCDVDEGVLRLRVLP